jgi:hypothetical protein
MASSEERLKILKMIQEGKITAEEGMHLIDALDENPPAPEPASSPTGTRGTGGKWLRVMVTDTNTGKMRVNVRLPIAVVSAGMKMGAKFSPEVEGLDMTQLMGYIRSGETGKIVDVYDDQDGEHVEVYIE